jgi:hypothetical protein
MNIRVALSIGALAFLGLIFRITPGASNSSPRPSATAGVAEGAKNNQVTTLQLTNENAGPWLSTCAHFGRQLLEGSRDGAPKDRLQTDNNNGEIDRGRFLEVFCVPEDAKAEVETVVVTVPNPASTNLGYFTDRALEGVIRAFAVPGWNFDSAFLPWIGIDEAGNKWIERDPLDPEPGVVIFRKEEKVFLAFIVGETPSGGIDLRPLKKALRYSKELATPPAVPTSPPTVSMIGPVFSGSVASLRLAVNAMKLADFKGVPLRVNAFSGTLTSDEARKRLKSSPNVTFHAATYGTRTFQSGLMSTALHLGLRPYEVALLIERDSDFGQDYYPKPLRKTFPTRVIRFPKDISVLRNAYKEMEGVPTVGGIRGILPFSWHDSSVGGDSIAILSRTNTLQSHYAVLGSIVEDLRRRTKLVEIVATNVLDALFLSSVIRDGAPGTRILIPDADVLFVRAAREQGLTGVLALTPFPLFGLDSITQGRYRTFAGSDAAGVFNAAGLYLLHHGGFESEPAGDYSNLRSGNEIVPPMWLAEVTHTGYWPIRRFPGATTDGIETIPLSDPSYVLPDPPYAWWVLEVIVVVGSILLTLWIIRSRKYADRRWSHFLAKPKRPGDGEGNGYFKGVELQWILARQGTLACATAAVLCLTIPLSAGVRWNPGLILAVEGAIAAVALLIYVSMNKGERGYAGIWIGIGVGVSSWFVWGSEGRDNELTALRAVEIFSGASPSLPVLLLVAGLMIGSVVHFRRMSLTFDRNPDIPKPEGHAAGMPYRQLEFYWLKSCDMWRSRTGVTIWEYSLVVISGFLLVFLLPHMRSVHGLASSMLVSALAWILLVAILWSATLFYRGWAYLRSFLLDLRCLPLNGAFHRLPPEYSTAPIWRGAPNRRNFEVLVRGAECLRELTLKGTVHGKAISDLSREMDDKILEIRKHQVNNTNEDYTQISAIPRKAASFIITNILEPEWSAGRIDAASTTGATKPGDSYVLAAEFVALRYAAAIRYGMLHLRNLIWFISGGFLLLAVALDLADLQGPDVVRWFITGSFVVLGYLIVRPLLQMQEDKILSLMATTETGDRKSDLTLKLLSYGAGPLLAVISSFFPSLSRFLFSWLQPTLENLK